MSKDDIIFGSIHDDEFTPIDEEVLVKETGLSKREMKIAIIAALFPLSQYKRIHNEIEGIVQSDQDIEANIYRWLAKIPSVVLDHKLFENI